MNTAITIKHLKKAFNHTKVFEDFNMNIPRGKITALFGPNGSGKTTLLDILSGRVSSDGGSYQTEAFSSFSCSYLFQNYRETLFPWRTNFENVALPLEIQGKKRSDIQKKINELQDIFKMVIPWERYPYELSGGQQQFLACMRAFATEPKILLVDEPFSALDYENNLKLRDIFQTYYITYSPTILLVTHQIEEAVHLASAIAVFSKKPTRVVRTVDNHASYPRTLQFLKTEQAHQKRNDILTAFQGAIRI